MAVELQLGLICDVVTLSHSQTQPISLTVYIVELHHQRIRAPLRYSLGGAALKIEGNCRISSSLIYIQSIINLPRAQLVEILKTVKQRSGSRPRERLY
ncbi:hypothetical protein M378DRAFT_563306 [Amanita muscaria Koide BX008]|uniref:Uncharacterized protein n=1 Tax=Amanita muscaria (strain Koide BX008) TaxID=946122 RepID=A0A0C2TDB1_AMAMK|nr:hypothetical protein M378DRAFT_563306 [Amanita muscaria Koide BX008]